MGVKQMVEQLNNLDASQTQVGGDHYVKYAISPLEFISKNNLDYVQGNVIKYVVRYKDKGGLEDLLKARHYIDLLIEIETRETASRESNDYAEYLRRPENGPAVSVSSAGRLRPAQESFFFYGEVAEDSDS